MQPSGELWCAAACDEWAGNCWLSRVQVGRPGRVPRRGIPLRIRIPETDRDSVRILKRQRFWS